MEQLNTKTNELNTNELDAVSGGFIWIPVVVVSFLVGTAIRAGIDKVVEKITK
jgi:bacteriocin-like protein